MRASGRRGWRGRHRAGHGASLHLRLRVRTFRRPAGPLRHLRQEARGIRPRWIQRDCARLWTG